ncbi:sulfatase-like hydrolase/transferase [Planctomycetaceae bacterium SH139]
MIDNLWHRPVGWFALATCTALTISAAIPRHSSAQQADPLRDLQAAAWTEKAAAWGHWGVDPSRYSTWTNHSNRLVPLYTFGMSLDSLREAGSVYRSAEELERLYGEVPAGTLNPEAEYFDQTDVYRLQQQAVAAGKKYVFLIVFDGMDWQTTHAAATYAQGKVAYDSGRGTGLTFLDYRGAETDYGYIVTSPQRDKATYDVNTQRLAEPQAAATGGYDPRLGGSTPWATPPSRDYLIGRDRGRPHTVADSAATATSMTCGIKTFNGAIGLNAAGEQVESIARQLQRERGFRIGLVSSVPISHATPAAAYAHNVTRNDYQDLTRDLIGLPSVSHLDQPLPGMDVVLGGGWGELKRSDESQGDNFQPGNRYAFAGDVRAASVEQGGKYVVVERTPDTDGGELIAMAADRAIAEKHRLLGLFGVSGGHLPFQTADGGYNPTVGVNGAESYNPADVRENPTLAELTKQAIRLLAQEDQGFWLMVEAGDVDWANHDNNLDNSIGAVLSGDTAFEEVVQWIEAQQAWDDSVIILTADHGHYLNVTDPQVLTKIDTAKPTAERATEAEQKIKIDAEQETATEQPDAAQPAADGTPPNVVLIFMDDMGYADIGPFGATAYPTPNLDRMAREGRRFTDFLASSAVCSASRAALLTGCYHHRVGISGALGPASSIGIHQDEVTLAELCKSRGYATAMFGKWHLGHHPKFLPTNHGFDTFFGIPYSNDMWPLHPQNIARKAADPQATGPWPRLPMLAGTEVINTDVQPADQEQLTMQITARSVEFIEQHADQPFFLYVPHPMVHVPLYVSEKFAGQSGAGLFGDVMMEVDWSVGQILDAIERIGATKNTLVILTSDNGPWLSYGDHAGSAGPLREGKGTMFEGGYREPTLMRWPSRIPAGTTCDLLASTIDIFPTVAALIGAELPAHQLDGVDIRPLMFADPEQSPRSHFYCYYGGGQLQAVRNERFKLVFPHSYRTLDGRVGGTGGTPVNYSQAMASYALYDLDNDLGETTDVAAQHPAVVEQLEAVAAAARIDLGDKLTKTAGENRRQPGRLQMGDEKLEW